MCAPLRTCNTWWKLGGTRVANAGRGTPVVWADGALTGGVAGAWAQATSGPSGPCGSCGPCGASLACSTAPAAVLLPAGSFAAMDEAVVGARAGPVCTLGGAGCKRAHRAAACAPDLAWRRPAALCRKGLPKAPSTTRCRSMAAGTAQSHPRRLCHRCATAQPRFCMSLPFRYPRVIVDRRSRRVIPPSDGQGTPHAIGSSRQPADSRF